MPPGDSEGDRWSEVRGERGARVRAAAEKPGVMN